MAIVYQHIRLDTNSIFYIGIGKDANRAHKKCQRNPYWHNIVNKCGYKIEIIHENISWENAIEIEKALIKLHGRKNLSEGDLCNLTDGGEGVLGLKPTNETRKKMRKAWESRIVTEETKRKISLAVKGRKYSDEVKAKMSLSQIGNKNNFGKKRSNETKLKQSLSQKGKTLGTKRVFTNEHRINLSKALFGIKRSEETKIKISEAKKGTRISENTRIKLIEAAKRKPPIKAETIQKIKDKLKGRTHKLKHSFNHPQAKKIININTGEIYPCNSFVCEKFKISRCTLGNWLLGKVKNKSPFRYI